MREIACNTCGCHLGWMIDCGPCGSFFCDGCAEGERAEGAKDQ